MKEVHGGDIVAIAKKMGIEPEDMLDYSANINPLGMPESVKSAIIKEVGRVIHYPDASYKKIYHMLAKKHAVPESFILLGNGALELIYKTLAAVYMQKKLGGRKGGGGKEKEFRALIPAPSFSAYESAVKAFEKADIKFCPLNKNFELDERYLEALDEDMDIAFLCLPNNPTGGLPERELLRKIIKRAKQKDILLLADECFLDLTKKESEYSLIPLIQKNPHILVLKSFTKLHAIPGLRLGYLIASDKKFIENLKLQTPYWHINSLAAAAGEAALEIKSKEVSDILDFICRERIYLTKELRRLACKVWESEANFIFFQIKSDIDLYQKLLEKKIIIKKCDSYRFLDKSYYRIAVRKREDNKILICALEEILHSRSY